MSYSKHQQTRIPRGALGYQIASDAIAQRGMSLDITRIGTARWLDMRLEDAYADDIQNLVACEREISDLIDRMMTWTEEERKHETTQALQEITGRYLPDDLSRRARYNLFDSIRRADRLYGRENVAAFVAAFHPTKQEILSVVAPS